MRYGRAAARRSFFLPASERADTVRLSSCAPGRPRGRAGELMGIRIGMLRFLAAAFDEGAGALRARVAGIFGLVLAANALAWLWALPSVQSNPLLLVTGF